MLGYAAGSKAGLESTAPELLEELASALRPACLQVTFKTQRKLEHRTYLKAFPCPLQVYPGHKVARLFSVYANLLLPGQTVTLHLDVPEFIGVERSTCPSWLLVAAHCSGLFTRFRVNNVTAVCYPSSCKGGSLAVYHREGGVFPVEEGVALALDTDSHFHHSRFFLPRVSFWYRNIFQFKRVTSSLGTLPPSLPDHCVLEVDEESRSWKVISGVKVVAEHKEEDLRFSVSCKFHMFRSEEEMEEFYQEGKREALSAEKIIEGLLEELERRGLKLSKETPLYELAPVLVKEFVVPFAPNSADIEEMWK